MRAMLESAGTLSNLVVQQREVYCILWPDLRDSQYMAIMIISPSCNIKVFSNYYHDSLIITLGIVENIRNHVCRMYPVSA